jgi:hypothetical protein
MATSLLELPDISSQVPGLPDLPPPDERVVLRGADFGEVLLTTVAKKASVYSYAIIDGEAIALPAKPTSFRAAILGQLSDLDNVDPIAEKLVRGCFGARMVVVWAPGAIVAREQLGPTFASEPAVLNAARAIAAELIAAVRPSEPVEAMRQALDIPEDGPCIRRVARYEGPRIDWYSGLGVLAGLGVNPDIEIKDVATRLGLISVPVARAPEPLAGSMNVHGGTFESLGDQHGRGRSGRGYRDRLEEDPIWVRPQWRAGSQLVAEVAVRHGIPAAFDPHDEAARGVEGDLVLAADSVDALPLLRALVAPGLRLEAFRDGSTNAEVVASLDYGLFAPWDPVEEDEQAGWSTTMRQALAGARRELVDRTGGGPLAILPIPRADVLGFVGTSPLALRYTLELSEDDAPLPWRTSAAAKELDHITGYGPRWTFDVDAYRRELLAELVQHLVPGVRDPVREVSARLARLAEELQRVVNPALAEVEAMGCPPDLLGAIVAPLEATRSLLLAATPARLASELRVGAVGLAALIDIALASRPPSAPPELPPRHRGADDDEEEEDGARDEEHADDPGTSATHLEIES